MKRCILSMVLIFTVLNYFFGQSIEVEKIGELKKIKHVLKSPAQEGPYGLYVDELKELMRIHQGTQDKSYDFYFVNQNIMGISESCFVHNTESVRYDIFSDIIIGSGDIVLEIRKGSKLIRNHSTEMKGGISFILKNGQERIIFFVDKDGIPGAADTEGKIYNKHEAMAYLKEYDPTKYEESRLRAIELRVVNGFDDDEVLVWGQTYYSTPRILKEFWKPESYLYPNFGYQIQYDLQGNGYMADYDATGANSDITIVSPQGKHMAVISIHNFSKILETHNIGNDFTASTYVGFGGNIYYFVAGDEFTEVFRIRRTWGDPDMYALAINGYTEDKYGPYVKDVLSRMSKDELRLLRNHIFALYGFDFKSDDLKTYFDKQVWYTLEPGKTTADIQLPTHRQELFDLILIEEGKRK